MLRAKVVNQAALLRYYAKYKKKVGDPVHETLRARAQDVAAEATRLREFESADWDVARMSAMGHEGRAAALYWSGARLLVPPDLEFIGRRTRLADDPVNQALNYVYGCLYSEVWQSVALAGLDPGLGIVHGSERSAANLVFDLIEEHRAPYGDRIVWSLLGRGFRPALNREGLLSARSRKILASAWHRTASRQVRAGKRKLDLRGLLRRQTTTLAAIFRDGAGVYLPIHFRW